MNNVKASAIVIWVMCTYPCCSSGTTYCLHKWTCAMAPFQHYTQHLGIVESVFSIWSNQSWQFHHKSDYNKRIIAYSVWVAQKTSRNWRGSAVGSWKHTSWMSTLMHVVPLMDSWPYSAMLQMISASSMAWRTIISLYEHNEKHFYTLVIGPVIFYYHEMNNRGNKQPKLLCIVGNIGAGKSTLFGQLQ